MTSLNRGEWSELYGILVLILEPKIKIVDSEYNLLSDAIFTLKKILLDINDNLNLSYDRNSKLCFVYLNGKKYNEIDIEKINAIKNTIYKKIVNNDNKNGAFSIAGVDKFLDKFSKGHLIKSASLKKSDLALELHDSTQRKNVILNYSIKSQLGSPATLLNSSSHTNFRYKVTGIDISKIKAINKINTRTKLLDRINKIHQLNGKIKFEKVVSNEFEYNLRMIDEKMPKYIGNALLESYVKNEKNLYKAFIDANKFIDDDFATKKLGDFLKGVAFSFVPGTKWDGKTNIVNGGFMIVTITGEVVFLDLLYYEEEVRKYLITNTKFDSPSSTRYHMLELKSENNIDIYFTLNLQIRYIR